ncbi:MAG: transposase [Candidatus Gracilibacteria bacterium]|nr:transposase [Candidatus Gracilibacteria bacterium]
MTNKSYKKICKKCKSTEIKKDGFMRGKQRYKCKCCGYVFQNKTRSKNIEIKQIWNDYCFGKQTYAQLSEKYGESIKTIQKILDSFEFIPPIIKPREIILLMDTTYFGDFGIMVFKDYDSKKIINFKIVLNENNADYKAGVKELQEKGWIIKAIVCDGRKGLLGGFPDIPTQMCNFHQVAIIRRYITKKPILEANKELKNITELLTKTDKESFTFWLGEWYEKHKDFLGEKVIGKDGKSHYLHKRTRSAYFSLKNNLKYLFVRYDYLGQIEIPNTTNGLEGVFGHIKPKISLHR